MSASARTNRHTRRHVAASFDYVSGEGRMSRPGFYLHISPEEVLAGGGFYMPMPEQVRAIRTSMVAKPEAFLKVINDPKLKKRFGKLLGERLQRPPLGFGDPPELSEYLKHKQFYVITNYSPDAPCHVGFARTARVRFPSRATFDEVVKRRDLNC